MSKVTRSPSRGASWSCNRPFVHFDDAEEGDDEHVTEEAGTRPMKMTSTPINANVLDSDIFFEVEDEGPDETAFFSPSSEDLTVEQPLNSGVVEANTANLNKDSTETEATPSSSNSPDSVWDTDFHKMHMAAISSNKFDSLLKMLPAFHDCKSHMAAFVLVREVPETSCNYYQVVALGTGHCCCTSWLCFNGTMVHNCHAMIIARRALQRFLYKQLLLFFDADPQAKEACVFESSADGPQLRLKDDISLHLYTNLCPEGAARDFYMRGSAFNTRTPVKLQYHAKSLLVPAAHLNPSHWASKVCCVSPTDKLCLWTLVGVQGALLSHFIRPLYITSMVLGGQKLYADRLSDITAECLGDGWEDILPPFYKKFRTRFLCCEEVRPVEASPQRDVLSVNWCLGDGDVEVVDPSKGFLDHSSPSMSGAGFSSRLCKRAFYSYFRKVAQLGGHAYLRDLPDYHHVKVEAGVYQTIKELVKQHFLSNHCGPWNSKKLVDFFSA
ncbi:adenosine deaminase domain-containing protein 2 isoform X2 [Festucalex cinctus]